MYTSTKFTSDLMNSYAWDTAVLFLQECGTNSTYSLEDSVNNSFAATGTNNETKKDVQCNIYDMASNLKEWTTETSTASGFPCILRGARYNDGSDDMCSRTRRDADNNKIYNGFRPILYL